jgi:pyruvate/2-oxoglutarate dehydrogenase complex dihydrolipoamide acyltransferase (E2) component
MRTPVVLPDLGARPVQFSLWFADAGDAVYEGDRLAEVLTNGATFDVSAPATGTLVERLAWPRDPVVPGQVLGVVESPAEDEYGP